MKSKSDQVKEILKKAILLEKQGEAFYSKVAEQSESESLKSIFETMAKEEEKHVMYLSEHFAGYEKNGIFSTTDQLSDPSELADAVLSEEIKKSINAAGYEAAAVSAAIEMEKKAVSLYQSRAKATNNEKEKELYNMLAKWELTHLDLLTDLNDAIVESVWNENSFWPY